MGYTTEKNKYVNSHESIIFDDFTLDKKFVDFPYMVKSSAIKILTLKNEKKDNIRFNFELLSNHRFNMLGHARHYISVVQPEEVFTTNIQEQNKIGDLFTNLDNLITLHQRKFNYILSHKLEIKLFFFKITKNVWEQRKLGELYNFRYGDGNHNPSNGGKYDVYGANGIIGGYDKFNSEDSIIIGHMGEYAGSVLWAKGKHFVTYNGTITRPKRNNIDDKFGYYMLYRKELNKICGGSGLPFLSYQELNKVEVNYSKDKDEQIKISKLLTDLDNLITLHQRKCTYIFYSWEQRKLEEISNRFDNLRVPVSANEREKGTTPYYGANGIQDYVKGFTHNGEYVLIAEDGANDLKNYPVKYVNGLFWANNHVHVVQGKEGICDNKYLKYCFTKTNIESLLVGGGRAKLNANIMMSIDLTVPSFNEQVELGRMFYELDNLITLHQHKELKRRNDNNDNLRW